jgi:hypothetical protein
MDIKAPRPSKLPLASRRVVLDNYTERSFWAYAQPETRPSTAPQRIDDVAPPGSWHPRPVKPVAVVEVFAGRQPQQIMDIIRPEPFARPAKPKLQRSHVLARRTATAPQIQMLNMPEPIRRHFNKAQVVLVSTAVVVFGFGLLVSINTLLT